MTDEQRAEMRARETERQRVMKEQQELLRLRLLEERERRLHAKREARKAAATLEAELVRELERQRVTREGFARWQTVPGLTVIEEFISADEEREIMAFQDPPRGPRPAAIAAILQRLVDAGLIDTDPPPAMTNFLDYHVGRGFPMHPGGGGGLQPHAIVGFRSSAVMGFARTVSEPPEVEIRFPARALVHMAGPALRDWCHSILPVAERRGSMVFANPRRRESWPNPVEAR